MAAKMIDYPLFANMFSVGSLAILGYFMDKARQSPTTVEPEAMDN